MLVLGRKTNQSVMIGDEIVITILAVDGDRVKVGIEAPANVRILRQELYDAVKEENLRAVAAATASPKAGELLLLPSLQNLFQAKE
jgi:carbon storage regulator